MADTVFDTARRIKERPIMVDKAVEPAVLKKAIGIAGGKRKAKSSLADAKRSERTENGVKSFGAPIDMDAFNRQNTDSNN